MPLAKKNIARHAASYLKREGEHIAKFPGDLSPKRVWDELHRLNHLVMALRQEFDRASNELLGLADRDRRYL